MASSSRANTVDKQLVQAGENVQFTLDNDFSFAQVKTICSSGIDTGKVLIADLE